MIHTNIRLAYQTETGLSLDTINRFLDDPCMDPELVAEYIRWLEEMAELMLFIQDVNATLTSYLGGGDGTND